LLGFFCDDDVIPVILNLAFGVLFLSLYLSFENVAGKVALT